MPNIDPSIYATPLPDDIRVKDKGTVQPSTYMPPEPVDALSALDGSVLAAEGAANVQDARREHADVTTSMRAAMSEWSTTHILKGLTGPTFAAEEGYSPSEQMALVDLQLSKEEEGLLLKSGSTAQFQHTLENIKESRWNMQQIGDHPIMGMLMSAVDPAYLAVDVASIGMGRVASAAKVGRTMAALGGAAGAAGIGIAESEYAAVSDNQIILNSLLNGAAGALTYSKGKLKLADTEFGQTARELDVATDRYGMQMNPDIGQRAAHGFDAPLEGTLRNGEELAVHLQRRLAGTEYEELATAIARAPESKHVRVSTDPRLQFKEPGALGYYFTAKNADGVPENILYLRREAGEDVALHELVHATLQNRIIGNPALREEMKQLRKTIFDSKHFPESMRLASKEDRAGASFAQGAAAMDDGEFIAYAFSSPTFRQFLRSQEYMAGGLPKRAVVQGAAPVIPAAPKALTMWDKVKDLFKRALGIEGTAARQFDQLTAERAAAMAWQPEKLKTLDEQLDRVMREAFTGPEADIYLSGRIRMDGNGSLEASKAAGKFMDEQQRRLGEKVSWSLHKTLGKYSRHVADTLVDDPLNMAGASVVAHKEAIRRGLTAIQLDYNDALLKAMAAQGAGVRQRVFRPGRSLKIQQQIERDVALEMLQRDKAARLGTTPPPAVSPEIGRMADELDRLSALSVAELKSAGVSGAELLETRSGYFQRRWDMQRIEDAERRIQTAQNLTVGQSRQVVRDLMATSLASTNGWTRELSEDVASAILDRARRKGYLEDTAFRSHAGNEAAAEVRDVLQSSGLSPDRIQRAMDVITGVVDEAGKAPILKKRMQMDMFASHTLPDGSRIQLADLIDTDMARITDRYVDTVSAQAAFARKGLGDASSIGKLRTEMLHSIPTEAGRKEAADLFDNTIAAINGNPSGEAVPQMMRNMQAATQMVGLSSSALWQLTEYATAMHKYGLLKTLKYATAEMPGFRQLFSSIQKDKGMARDLRNILADQSAQDFRMKAYTNRLEDGFHMPPGDTVALALQHGKQLVPYINGMKYVHHHQARVVSNLITDTLVKAAKGDSKARGVLAQYGLEGHVIDKIKGDIIQGGLDTSKWADGTFNSIRTPLAKMMDEAVLKNRLGEIPAFAQFTSLGKFVFTFRSFVLGAHNKILANTLSKDGIAGLSLLMLYQFPLALMAAQANATLKGKSLAEGELPLQAVGQMGSIGLFSELWGIATGQKQQFGSPGMIFADRMAGVVGAAASGDAQKTGSQLMQSIPLMSVIPGIKAIGTALTE